MRSERAQQALAASHRIRDAKRRGRAATRRLPVVGAGSLSRAEALKSGGARVAIDTPSVDGSLLLKGARFDDLQLKNYRETIDPKSPEIVLFSPDEHELSLLCRLRLGRARPAASKCRTTTACGNSPSGTTLTPNSPVTLTWDNGQGLVFTRTIAVDKNYMFNVRDTVANHGSTRASRSILMPMSRATACRRAQHFWALHEGYVGVANGTLKDAELHRLQGRTTPPQTFQSTGGWLGITDKYWMAAVIPPQTAQSRRRLSRHRRLGDTKAYQANYRLGAQTIAPGATTTVDQRLFAGAKDRSAAADL